MTSYVDWEERTSSLIRKSLRGSAFIAPYATANLAALTTGSNASLVTLPTGYQDLGWVTKDGMGFGRETENSEVTSFGSSTPTRTDQTSDVLQMTVTAQETKLAGKPFQRFDRPGTVTGAGLGLAIAMELARRMGGAMVLNGGQGRGAIMELRLPRL